MSEFNYNVVKDREIIGFIFEFRKFVLSIDCDIFPEMAVNQINAHQQIQTCRICLGRDQLIMSCNSKNDFAYVHEYCLNRWLELTGYQFCDLCQFKFILKRENKSYKSWLLEHNEQIETLLELCVQTINIVHIYVLGLIALLLFNVRLFFKCIIGMFVVLRTFNIIRLWGLLITRHIGEYKDWKKNHLNVKAQTNPNRYNGEIKNK